MRNLILALLIGLPTIALADLFVSDSDKRVVIETGTGDKEGYIIDEGTLAQINRQLDAEQVDLNYYQEKATYKQGIINGLRQKYQDYRDAGAQTEAEYQAEHAPVINQDVVVNSEIQVDGSI